MPAKKTTIATAEKRVLKAEIAATKKALRKIESDRKKEQLRIIGEIRKLGRGYTKSTNACRRESATATRRLAILEGRLHS